jgi:hypothetical protein
MGERVLERQPPKKPVIKSWFEPGSVILKILVVNPSQTEAQTIPVKVYLPKEASPKDIIDHGDLKLDYDQEAGMYYVHAEVTLEPGQSVTKMVKIEDVWVFTEEQLSSFVNQAKELANQLKETSSAEEAAALVLGVEKKVQEILKRQKETATDPGEHMRAYRQGLTVITTIEQDLSALDGLKQDASMGEGKGKGLPVKGSHLDSGSGDSDSQITVGPGSNGPPEGGGPPRPEHLDDHRQADPLCDSRVSGDLDRHLLHDLASCAEDHHGEGATGD